MKFSRDEECWESVKNSEMTATSVEVQKCSPSGVGPDSQCVCKQLASFVCQWE